MKTLRLLILFVVATGWLYCSQVQVDKSKFEAVHRAAKSIEASTQIGVTYPKFAELLQGLATEISITQDQSLNTKEQELLGLYQDTLGVYNDSLGLWKTMIEFSGQRSLSGAILYGEVADIAHKYDLPPIPWYGYESIEVIPEESRQFLWTIASDKLNAANSIYSGNPQSAISAGDLALQRENIYRKLQSLLEQSRRERKEATEAAARERKQAAEAVTRAEQKRFSEAKRLEMEAEKERVEMAKVEKEKLESLERERVARVKAYEKRMEEQTKAKFLDLGVTWENPEYATPDSIVYYYATAPGGFYHRKDCPELAKHKSPGLLYHNTPHTVVGGAYRLKPCPICKAPVPR